MKIVVGLGNPGKQYEATRHNAGRMLVDELARRMELVWEVQGAMCLAKSSQLWLIKSSDVFMNESGKLVQNLQIKEYELWVAHDDLDIHLGEYKIQHAKGPEVHGGVNDIERVYGKDFWRIRIGIDNRSMPRTPGEEYVLQKFEEEELKAIEIECGEIIKVLGL